MSVNLALENLERSYRDVNSAITTLYAEADGDLEKMTAVNEADELLSGAFTKAKAILKKAPWGTI